MKKFPILIGLILSVMFLAGCAKSEPRVVYKEYVFENPYLLKIDSLYVTSGDPQKSAKIEGFNDSRDLKTSLDGKWLLGIEVDGAGGDNPSFSLHALDNLTGKEIFLPIPDEVMHMDDMDWEILNTSTDGGIYLSLSDLFVVPENTRMATWKVNLQTGKFSLVSKTFFDQQYSIYTHNAGLRWDKAIHLFGTFSSRSRGFMYYPATKEFVTTESKGDGSNVPSWNQDMTQYVTQTYFDARNVECWVLDTGKSEVELGCVSLDPSPDVEIYGYNHGNAVWSPNGKYIALAVYDPDSQMNKVSIFDRSGDFVSSVEGLGYMTANWVEPLAWSPDSTKVAFLTDSVPWRNTVGIYSLSLSGKTKLEYSSPDWGIHSADVIDVVGWVR